MTRDSFKLSVVIPNFNYAGYIADAIDTALDLDWPDVEVIVVDDGSTDHSRGVIEAYGSRITAIFKENTGQYGALNIGFAHSHGNVVIFLDSDDYLDPSIVREIAAVWRPGVSKVQFQMRVVDAAGRAVGNVLPQYRGAPTPQEIREWVRTTSAYPTPPGSGNAYARDYLQQIFPLDDSCGRAGDSCCIAAAPYLGDVITVPKPLVAYRVHGRNDGAQTELDPLRFGREVIRAARLFAYSQNIARGVGIDVPDNALFRSLSLLGYRVASRRLVPEKHPFPLDSRVRIVADLLRGLMYPQGVSPRAKIALCLWMLAVLFLPAAIARQAVLWRFAPTARPQVLRLMLRRLGIIGKPQPR